MYKKIVLPIVLLIFILQTNNLLFANENAETKTKGEAKPEVKTEASTEAVMETEVTAEVSTEPVAEASTEAEAKSEVSTEVAVETENDVVAAVNGEKIFRKELDRRLSVFKRMNQEITRSNQLLIVDQLTRSVLLGQFIDKQDIEVSNEEIEGELEKVKFFFKSNPKTSEKELEEVLESKGSNVDALKERIKRTIALSKYLRKEDSDDEKRKYFDENKSSFNGEQVKVSHILIDTRGIKTNEELEKARQKIENIKKEIDGGADIAELAKKYSDCPSAEKGGDIGFFERRGSIVEPFAKVAFSMKVGEISEPVKTQFGYHIIKVTDKKKGKNVNYEDVKEKVDFVFTEIKKGNLINSLIEKAKIEVFL